jgi:ABC-type glutathione transport system ATPase component
VPDNREDILLKIKNLTVALKRSDNTTLSILDNINLSLNREQRVAIIGQSGSGKTITSRAILGLLPENMRIISGRISFDNKNITIDNESALEDLRGEKIAMIFQEPHAALNPVFRIETQLTDVIRTNLKLSKKSAVFPMHKRYSKCIPGS